MRPLPTLMTLALLLAVTPLIGRAAPAADEPAPPPDDALVAPEPPLSVSSTIDMRGPSQYMAGKVAVRLVLAESNGGAEADTERWTPEEISSVTAQVRSALDWWEARLPLARLSFTLRTDIAATAYEPVNHGLVDEGLWIGDSLRSLGYQGQSYFDQAYAAGDALRAATGADWTTTIFVADSSAQPGGYFADGRFAYAYINGPFMVLTSDAGGYGAGHLAPVVAHELGHIFGALDQYAIARVPCERRSGYLNAPSSNSQYNNCGGREQSIMLEPNGAFTSGMIDASARAQIGYSDADGDGLIDPLDTAPDLALSDTGLAMVAGRPSLHGTAHDIPFPAPYQQQVTLNTIAAVEFRVAGGAWLPLPPADGAYDESAESFAAELPLYDGVYALEVRARNSAGAVSPLAMRSLMVSGVGPAPDYRSTAPALTSSPSVGLGLEAPAGTAAVQASESPTFAAAPWQPYAAALPFTLAGPDGDHTIYVRFRDDAGRESLPTALSVTLDTTPPTGVALRDPASATALILNANDTTSGVAAVEVRVGAREAAWQPYTPTIQLGAGSEGQAVTLRLRDGAGNLSAPFAAPDRYKVALPLIVR